MLTGLSDYHVHSIFSLDGVSTPERIIESAVEKGLLEICLTEHKDLDRDYEYWDYYKDGPYTEEIARLNEKFHGKIKVLKGVELDYTTDTSQQFDEFLQNHSFDFVLASVHALEHYFVDISYFNGKDPMEVFRDYLKEVHRLSARTDFDILGHLDYVTRHAPKGCLLKLSEFKGIIESILENIIKNRRGIELNTGGIRQGINKPYPSPEILKLYHKMGGRIITLGSDSHHFRDVGADFDKGLEILYDAGFRKYCAFNRREVRFIELP